VLSRVTWPLLKLLVNSAPGNVKSARVKSISVRCTRKDDYLWTKIERPDFFISKPKYMRFCNRTWQRLLLILLFSGCRLLNLFRRYSRSNSEVVRNRAKLWSTKPIFSGPTKSSRNAPRDTWTKNRVKFTPLLSCGFDVRSVPPVRWCPAKPVPMSPAATRTVDQRRWTELQTQETAAASRPTPAAFGLTKLLRHRYTHKQVGL